MLSEKNPLKGCPIQGQPASSKMKLDLALNRLLKGVQQSMPQSINFINGGSHKYVVVNFFRYRLFPSLENEVASTMTRPVETTGDGTR